MSEAGVGQLLKIGLLLKASKDRKESNRAILKFLRFSLKLKFVLEAKVHVTVKRWVFSSARQVELETSKDKPVKLRIRLSTGFGDRFLHCFCREAVSL